MGDLRFSTSRARKPPWTGAASFFQGKGGVWFGRTVAETTRLFPSFSCLCGVREMWETELKTEGRVKTVLMVPASS